MLSVFSGGLLFGERVGSSDPNVLFLHGWRGDHTQMTAVASGFDGISLDLSGFGASPEPKSTWGASEYADAVANVLSEFKTAPVVVGYSFGGRVAVNLAAKYPEQIKALVLTGVPLIRKGPSKPPPLKFRLAKYANKIGLISNARMEAERRKRGSADYRAATGVMRDVFVKLVNESYESQLEQIACRVELVWGDSDTEAPLSNAHEAQAILSHSNLTIVPGGTHWSLVKEATEIQKAIRNCF